MMAPAAHGKQATTSEQKAKGARDDATRATRSKAEYRTAIPFSIWGIGGSIDQHRRNRLGELLREQKNVPLREMSLVWPAYQSSLKYEATLERNDDASRRVTPEGFENGLKGSALPPTKLRDQANGCNQGKERRGDTTLT